jgi:hypothetical protein
MKSRRLPATLPAVLMAAVLAAGCTSSATKKTSASSTSNTSATALASKLTAGLAGVSSVHLAVTTDLAGQQVQGSGGVRLANGTLSQGDITEQLPGGLGEVRLVIIGGKTYAKLPPAVVKTDKPWVLVAPDSSNPVVSQLAATITTVLAVASPSSVVAFARAAKSVDNNGVVTINGVETTHYKVSVDAAKLPSTFPGGGASGAAIPVELYIDAKGRPIQINGKFTVLGQALTPKVVLSDYNKPVSVSAPPANQVTSK